MSSAGKYRYARGLTRAARRATAMKANCGSGWEQPMRGDKIALKLRDSVARNMICVTIYAALFGLYGLIFATCTAIRRLASTVS